MEKRVYAVRVYAASILACLVCLLCISSCDIFDDDDTEIVVRNSAWQLLGMDSWYITEIEIRKDTVRQVFYSSVEIGPGEERSVDVDEGTYLIRIEVRKKNAAGAWYSGKEKYSVVRSVSNGKTLTVDFNGKGFD